MGRIWFVVIYQGGGHLLSVKRGGVGRLLQLLEGRNFKEVLLATRKKGLQLHKSPSALRRLLYSELI